MIILFVTSNRIGDAVLSTGLLDHLITSFPHARITLACGPLAAPLFAEVPNIERIITMPKQSLSRHWLSLWSATVGRVWDMVVDLRASALAWLLVAKDRRVLHKTDEGMHRLRLLSGVLGLKEAAAPRIWTSDTYTAMAEDLIPSGGPVLAVGPTANWGGKQWPAESFAEFIARMTGKGGRMPDARVAILGAAGERAAAAPVIDSVPAERCIDLVGGADLLTAYACIERCGLYVGNDSGLMHLAAASGTPTLGLFGPSRDEHYAPWGERTAVVRTPESYDQILASPGYDYRDQKSLMTSLSVDRVAEAVDDLLGPLADVRV